MSEAIARRSELLRLARVLGAEPAALSTLAEADPADLRALRLQVADHLLERNRRSFERAVALADLIPVGLAAKLAERALGPVLSGRAATFLTADKAGEFAGRLPPDFLADVAVNLDLRRTSSLLAGIPLETLAAAGARLRAREEWIVLGVFLGYVDSARLPRLLEDFDPASLLRTGFVVEERARLDEVVAALGDDRLDELLEAAWAESLWHEAVSLVAHLGDRQRDRIVAAVERLPDDRTRALADALRADPELLDAAGALVDAAPPRLIALLDPAGER